VTVLLWVNSAIVIFSLFLFSVKRNDLTRINKRSHYNGHLNRDWRIGMELTNVDFRYRVIGIGTSLWSERLE
jgi:hypothetical protein